MASSTYSLVALLQISARFVRYLQNVIHIVNTKAMQDLDEIILIKYYDASKQIHGK